MELSKVLTGVKTLQKSRTGSLEISGIAYDSRQVKQGWLFAAIKGEKLDGNQFVSQAVERGASAVLSEQPPRRSVAAPWIQVSSVRQALAQAAANFYGHPARQLKLIGITGTNGKTTTTFLLESILRAAGFRVGLFGTVEYHTAAGTVPAAQTTPESLDLQQYLAGWRDAGAEWMVMEVSSHGLAFDRVYGLPFAAAVFTNLARDHLDFHQTMDNYFQAKQQLFLGQGTAPPALSVLNTDDPRGRQLAQACRGEKVLYGLAGDAETVTALDPKISLAGTQFTLRTPGGRVAVRSQLVGKANLHNLLAAGATAYGLGLPLEAIAAGLETLQRVPGRFERVHAGQPFTVVVDFAHTDLAFTHLLTTARELARGRVIIVFGSGGDRDRTKRPVMGEIAGRLSDTVILTTDNPRSEDPVGIINDIVVGVQKAGGRYEIVLDRKSAFERAFEIAREGDIVLLVGKGHQDTQVYADRVEPWSEIEAAQRALARRGYVRAEAAPSNAVS